MEGRILREKESGWVDADRCFCSLSTSPCAVVVSLLPFRFPCTRCPVFVNTRPVVNSKASKLRAVCHTTHHETHFVLVRVVQTFLFMHFSYLGQTSVSLSLSPVPLIHQPDSRYETDKRCFPLFSLSSQIIYVRLRDRRLNDHEGTALSKKSFRVIAEQSSF